MPNGKKTMDVAKPGNSAPDTSARPVIVSHRPMVQDPMVKTDDEPAVVAERHGDKVVMPPSETEEQVKLPDKAIMPAEEDSPSSEPPADEELASSEAATVDAVANSSDVPNKKKTDQLTKEEQAKQAALQTLIDQKKYFLPVGQVGKRRHNRYALVVLVVLLALAGGYMAVDAGLVKTNLKLPIDLIKS